MEFLKGRAQPGLSWSSWRMHLATQRAIVVPDMFRSAWREQCGGAEHVFGTSELDALGSVSPGVVFIDQRTEEFSLDKVQALAASASWVVLCRPSSSWYPDFLFDSFALASNRKVQVESLGRPLIGQFGISVYRRRGFTPDVPELPIEAGPGTEGPVWWPSEIFFEAGFGTELWMDDPAVLSAVYDCIQGKSPPWIEPGFAFALPPSMLQLPTAMGEMAEGVLCRSTKSPGSWMLLSAIELSSDLGIGAIAP